MVERRLEHAEPTGEAGRQFARDRAERPTTRHRLDGRDGPPRHPPGRPARATRGGAGAGTSSRRPSPARLDDSRSRPRRPAICGQAGVPRQDVGAPLPVAQARERGELPTQERAGGLAPARVDIEPRLRKVVSYRHLPKLREALQRKTPNRSLHSYRAKPETTSTSGFGINPGSDLLSHTVTRAVPSAVEGLTTVFGMGTGVTPLLSPPGNGRPIRRSATSG